jgi:hypothetical protein
MAAQHDGVGLADGAQALAALTNKYRQYEVEPPPGPLLRLAVDRALCWRAADG